MKRFLLIFSVLFFLLSRDTISAQNYFQNTDGIPFSELLKVGTKKTSAASARNTIFIVNKDYNLQGANVQLPEGCILKFNGGVISNGTIIGDGSIIDAYPVQIFESNLLVRGNWITKKWFAEWFGAKELRSTMHFYDRNNDWNKYECGDAILSAISNTPEGCTLIMSGNYYSSKQIVINRNINVEANGTIYAEPGNNAVILMGLDRVTIKINKIVNSWKNGTGMGLDVFKEDISKGFDRTSIGLVVRGCTKCEISVGEISTFITGLLVVSVGEDNLGTYFNRISANLNECLVGIRITSVNKGWVNGNIFNDCRCMFSTWNLKSAKPEYDILKDMGFIFSNSCGTTYSNNANHFNNLIFECHTKPDATSSTYLQIPNLARLSYASGWTLDFSRIEYNYSSDKGAVSPDMYIKTVQRAWDIYAKVRMGWNRVYADSGSIKDYRIVVDQNIVSSGKPRIGGPISDYSNSIKLGENIEIYKGQCRVLFNTQEKICHISTRLNIHKTLSRGSMIVDNLPKQDAEVQSIWTIVAKVLTKENNVTDILLTVDKKSGTIKTENTIPSESTIIIDTNLYLQ